MGGERWRVEVVNLACVLRATTKQTKKTNNKKVINFFEEKCASP